MPEVPLLAAIIGGSTLGLGAGGLMLFNGRIAGIGGSFSSVVVLDLGDARWKLFFVLGILIGGASAAVVFPGHFDLSQFDVPMWAVVVSGLLMGFGGRMCNGCTSGHGVCGVARLSRRSMVATATFFAFTLGSTYVLRHVIGVF